MLLAIIALIGFVDAATAEVKPMNLFRDQMILQRADRVPVWGTADPGEQVTVEFAGQSVTTTADNRGKWLVHLEDLSYGGPHEMVVKGASNEHRLKDVLVGEVWITSGQSNMGPLGSTKRGAEFIENAKWPELRWVSIFPSKETCDDHDDIAPAWWQKAEKENPSFRHWSAVGFHFGLKLHQALGVPVGLIHHARGGTPAESWMSMKTLRSDPLYAEIIERYEAEKAREPALREKYEAAMAEYNQAVAQAKAGGRPRPEGQPKMPRELRAYRWPSHIYTHMHEPLAPYAIRGFMFYQGESNGSRGYQYRKLLPDLIADWRNLWNDAEMPFLIVQVAMVGGKPHEGPPAPSGFAEVREAQTMTADADPHVGVAVTYDLMEPEDDIHYRHKQPAGERTGRVALAMSYGKDIIYSGPKFRRMEIEKNRVRIHFDHVHGRLVAQGGSLGGFALAGEDRQFHWAQAKVEGDTVVVWHANVDKPVAVRYGWCSLPCGANLYNAEGLPADQFRTDDWPESTIRNR
jgi:sialate O-acetylesterase